MAADIAERYQDLDELEDLGDIDLHISGCINSCGHHHSGHIGVLGVDKDGTEWYQLTLGGSDGSTLSGPAVAGKVIGPSFAADEIADAIEAVLDTYKASARAASASSTPCKRVGLEPFKTRRQRRAHQPPRERDRNSHEVHRPRTTTFGSTQWAKTAPSPTPIPRPNRLLSLEQWHAVRSHWPADCPWPSSSPTTPTSPSWRPT